MRFTLSVFLLVVISVTTVGCDGDENPNRSDDAAANANSELTFERASVGGSDVDRRDWRERDFGIGIVEYPVAEAWDPAGVLYNAPSFSADTVAVFGYRELCYMDRPDCIFLYGRMIEYTYEMASWAILDFDSDSSWAKVSIDPFDVDSVSLGWVPLSKGGSRPVLWSELLSRHWLFFLWPDSARFYDDPSTASPIEIELELLPGTQEFPKYDYSLIPLRVEGLWMQVEVASPSPTVCRSGEPPEVSRDTAWIPFLNAEGRPLTFFHTRGC